MKWHQLSWRAQFSLLLGRIQSEIGRQEVLIFGGLGLLTYGVAQVSPPVAFMVLGAGLLGVGILGTFFIKRGE